MLDADTRHYIDALPSLALEALWDRVHHSTKIADQEIADYCDEALVWRQLLAEEGRPYDA